MQIERIKIITIKNYLKFFGKRITGNSIAVLFAIFNLGFIVFDDNWYHFNSSENGWKVVTDVEILQNITIYLVCNIKKISTQHNYFIDLTNVSEFLNTGKIDSRSVDNLKSILFLSEFNKRLDKKPVLRFMDCVFDFEIMSPRPGRPSDFCSKGTGYSFYDVTHAGSAMPKINQFLKDIFVEDELINYILKILASTLTPGNKLRSLIFFIGSGRNGKTALTNILKYALGEYAAIPNVSLFLGKSVSSEKANPHMIELNNAHVAICEEPDARNVSITGDAKAITGNVGYIKARGLYKNLESVFIDLLPIINTNDKLTINNIDTALIDRILVIPFTQRFIPKHRTDKHKHKNEKYADATWQGSHSKSYAPAFMRLLLQHYLDDYTTLSPPKIVNDATAEFILRGDHPGRFIKQKLCATGNDNDILYLEDIYTVYKKWYKNYVNAGVLCYTTEDLRLDFAKYKIYFVKSTNKIGTDQEIDVLMGYKFY
jgi:P4 family phage/plasmid primase-like protien